MSLRCSVFGHRYGDPEVEREREEDGSEVIITIRESETCQRCGDVRIVSENKEVTTLETAADIVADDLDEEPAETEDAGEPEPAQPEPPQAGTDPSIPDAEGGAVGTVPESEVPDASEDDAVILEDDADEDEAEPEPDREPGEWPDEPGDDEDDWQPSTKPEPEPIDPDPEVSATGEAITVPEGSFYCPECEFTTLVEESSLRKGDFCPECHRGALEHHPE